jgi:dTDP-4-dehydrorhamnose 3,5-epimerase-like enzyme
MARIDQLELIPRRLRADSRGWFLKVIDGKEPGLPQHTGEVYLTMANPGQVRGNHFHHKAREWFTVVMGRAEVLVRDPQTQEERSLTLDASVPHTLVVPPGLAHAFKNPENATEPMLLVAYTDQLYDPADDVAVKLL